MRILSFAVACLIFWIGGTGSEINSRPYTDYYQVDDNVEEYFVEHAISTVQAKNAIKDLDLESVQPKAGCQECTPQEIRYCLGSQLMNDHCCCDKGYREYFPYVPHTCYIGKKLCKPLAKDCAEYTRLRNCCCDKLVLERWKEIISSGPKNYTNLKLVVYLIVFKYIFFDVNLYDINIFFMK